MSHTLLASGYGGEIATLHLDLTTKHFVTASTIQSGRAPTWLTLHPTLPVVYTGDEFAEPQGEIHAFTIDPKDGALSPLDTRKVGAGPVHFVISKGKHLYSANYGGGSLSTVALKEDGSFGEDEGEHFQYEGSGPHKERQEAPHTHGVYIDPTGEFLLAVDLGTDEIKTYKINGPKLFPLPPIKVAPQSGPRHLIFSQPSPSRTLVYLVQELSNQLDIFEVSYPNGGISLTPLQTNVSTLPPDAPSYAGDWTAAEVDISPCRGYLYVSNRAPLDPHPSSDTLTIFELDSAGKIDSKKEPTYFQVGGRGPRHFQFSPAREVQEKGKYLAVALQRTNEVVVFEVEGKKIAEVARVKDVKEPTAVVWL